MTPSASSVGCTGEMPTLPAVAKKLEETAIVDGDAAGSAGVGERQTRTGLVVDGALPAVLLLLKAKLPMSKVALPPLITMPAPLKIRSC